MIIAFHIRKHKTNINLFLLDEQDVTVANEETKHDQYQQKIITTFNKPQNSQV